MDLTNQYVMKQLQDILTELEGLPDLPSVSSQERKEMGHEEWINLSDKLNNLHGKADSVALITVPPEISEILYRIYRAWAQKHSWGKPRPESSTQVEKIEAGS